MALSMYTLIGLMAVEKEGRKKKGESQEALTFLVMMQN